MAPPERSVSFRSRDRARRMSYPAGQLRSALCSWCGSSPHALATAQEFGALTRGCILFGRGERPKDTRHPPEDSSLRDLCLENLRERTGRVSAAFRLPGPNVGRPQSPTGSGEAPERQGGAHARGALLQRAGRSRERRPLDPLGRRGGSGVFFWGALGGCEPGAVCGGLGFQGFGASRRFACLRRLGV